MFIGVGLGRGLKVGINTQQMHAKKQKLQSGQTPGGIINKTESTQQPKTHKDTEHRQTLLEKQNKYKARPSGNH